MNDRILTLTVLLAFLCSSCSNLAPYVTHDVNIQIDVRQVGHTYLQVQFSPDDDAYYFVDIIPWPAERANKLDSLDIHFMTLALDSANIEYMNWRHGLLVDEVPDVASFADHVLSYGKTDRLFTNLMEVNSYLVYAFVVDPDRMKPVGKLFYKFITPDDKTLHPAFFDLTIDGYWDFVYPMDTSRQVSTNVPYYVMFASYDYLQSDSFAIWLGPIGYFAMNYILLKLDKFNLGITMRKHDDTVGDETIRFEEGKTYYVAIGSCDAMYSYDKKRDELEGMAVYRIDWKGESTYKDFHYDTDTLGWGNWGTPSW